MFKLIQHKYLSNDEYETGIVEDFAGTSIDHENLIFNKITTKFFKSKIKYYHRLMNKNFSFFDVYTKSYKNITLDFLLRCNEVTFTLIFNTNNGKRYLVNIKLEYKLPGVKKFKTLV